MAWLWLVPLAVAIAGTAVVSVLATRAAREAIGWQRELRHLGALRGDLGALGTELRVVTEQFNAASEKAAGAEDCVNPPLR